MHPERIIRVVHGGTKGQVSAFIALNEVGSRGGGPWCISNEGNVRKASRPDRRIGVRIDGSSVSEPNVRKVAVSSRVNQFSAYQLNDISVLGRCAV